MRLRMMEWYTRRFVIIQGDGLLAMGGLRRGGRRLKFHVVESMKAESRPTVIKARRRR